MRGDAKRLRFPKSHETPFADPLRREPLRRSLVIPERAAHGEAAARSASVEIAVGARATRLRQSISSPFALRASSGDHGLPLPLDSSVNGTGWVLRISATV
jgi:hypothetical protein